MSAKLPSTKPYMIRAIHEWCSDNGFTPYISVLADARARIPREFVRDGQIVLNISYEATGHLKISNDGILFQARFGGVPRDISVPTRNVLAIYAKENGAGMAFELEESDEDLSSQEIVDDNGAPEPSPPTAPAGRPKLQRIK